MRTLATMESTKASPGRAAASGVCPRLAVGIGDLDHALATTFGGRFMAKGKTKRKLTPKTILRLPDLEQSRSVVFNS